MIKRTIGYRLGPVEGIGSVSRLLSLLNWFGSGLFNSIPVPSEVPFSDRGGRIPTLLQNLRHGKPVCIESGIPKGINDSVELAPMMPPG